MVTSEDQLTDPHLLSARILDNQSLPELFEVWGKHLGSLVGLAYTPSACDFVRFEQGHLFTINQSVKVSDCFELRLFNPTLEMRWLNQRYGRGRGILLFEEPLPDAESLGQPEDLRYWKFLPNQYLIWGEYSQTSEKVGWSELSTARIGTLAVPIGNVKPKQRVYLHTREYLSTMDTYGNVAVVEERLMELKVE